MQYGDKSLGLSKVINHYHQTLQMRTLEALHAFKFLTKEGGIKFYPFKHCC